MAKKVIKELLDDALDSSIKQISGQDAAFVRVCRSGLFYVALGTFGAHFTTRKQTQQRQKVIRTAAIYHSKI